MIDLFLKWRNDFDKSSVKPYYFRLIGISMPQALRLSFLDADTSWQRGQWATFLRMFFFYLTNDKRSTS